MHYRKCFRSIEAPYDFKSFWRQQIPSYRDGCDCIQINRTDYSKKRATQKRLDTFLNTATKHKDVYEGLHSPDSYTVVAYDIGITGYAVVQRKTKNINHKRTEVEVVKNYKSKPSAIPTGSKILEIHRYVISYDGRDYDPLEHDMPKSDPYWDREVHFWECIY